MSKEIDEKLSHDEKKYLNSSARVVRALIRSVIEYILIFIIIALLGSYIQYGNLENIAESIKDIGNWLQPGGVLFNALVGYLPIMILSCIGSYFGEGTFGKMAFGFVKCFAIILWIILILQGAEVSFTLPDMMANVGLDDLTIGTKGLSDFAIMVLLTTLLIPIGEFAGARKKHKRALAKKERIADAE